MNVEGTNPVADLLQEQPAAAAVSSAAGDVRPSVLPKDAQVIVAIMKEVGIKEWDPQVIPQMLEFVYKYTTTVLEDARQYANHAKKKNLDASDVKLAIKLQSDKMFTLPPSREVLAELAKSRNSIPLPPIKQQCGLRLPPDRYCLTQASYKMKGAPPPRNKKKVASNNSSSSFKSSSVNKKNENERKGFSLFNQPTSAAVIVQPIPSLYDSMITSRTTEVGGVSADKSSSEAAEVVAPFPLFEQVQPQEQLNVTVKEEPQIPDQQTVKVESITPDIKEESMDVDSILID